MRQWDVTSGKLLGEQRIDVPERGTEGELAGTIRLGLPPAVMLSPDGELLAATRVVGDELLVWETRTGRRSFDSEEPHAAHVRDLFARRTPAGRRTHQRTVAALGPGDGGLRQSFEGPRRGELSSGLPRRRANARVGPRGRHDAILERGHGRRGVSHRRPPAECLLARRTLRRLDLAAPGRVDLGLVGVKKGPEPPWERTMNLEDLLTRNRSYRRFREDRPVDREDACRAGRVDSAVPFGGQPSAAEVPGGRVAG